MNVISDVSIVFCIISTFSLSEIRDCKDVLDHNHSGGTMNDVELVLLGGHPTNVLCDMTTEGGGWTVSFSRQILVMDTSLF